MAAAPDLRPEGAVVARLLLLQVAGAVPVRQKVAPSTSALCSMTLPACSQNEAGEHAKPLKPCLVCLPKEACSLT